MAIITPAQRQFLLNRFPCKQTWDFLALAQIFLSGNMASGNALTFAQKMACLKFYFQADNVSRLFICPPRSGSRWSQLVIELALDLQRGGPGTYVCELDHFWPEKGQRFARLDWRWPTGAWIKQHKRAGGPVVEKLDFFVARISYGQTRTRRVPKMNIVLVTRSIPAILASLYTKLGKNGDSSTSDQEKDASFNWEWFISKLIAHYNSWGDVMTWHPSIRHYKYENLKADPLGTHMEILDFWGMPVDESNMAEALFRASKQEMLKHLPDKAVVENARISIRSQEDRLVLTESRLKWILDRLDRDLKYDFGHQLDENTSYNKPYE